MYNEYIAVVPAKLINEIYPTPLSTVRATDIDTILKNTIYYPRQEAEINEQYKQLVAYIIVTYKNNFFLVQRASNCSEKKLCNKYSIGIGGHLRAEDIRKTFLEWGLREFHEEVSYLDNFDIEQYAIINDNSNEVGKLHLGITYLISLTNNNITLQSELKAASFKSLKEVAKYKKNLEPWSQLLLDNCCPVAVK
jgi:predicted NUDIX family phosphoesterase